MLHVVIGIMSWIIWRYGIVACASSLNQVGPMTKTVEDAAILMNVISGRDPMDATSLDEPNLQFL